MHSAPTTPLAPVTVFGRRPPWTGRDVAIWCPPLVAVLCYLRSLGNGFALDDRVIIADDRPLHSLATLASALTRAYWYDAGHLYRPFTTLAFGLEWAAGHGSPLPFHAVNILWHALVASLVARLALRWWPPAAAGAAGVWFAVHPVHAEAVANIVGRSELVCTAALIALALLATARPEGPTGPPPAPARDRLPLWLAFALAACAMASKETGVVAPAIAWLAAITPWRGDDTAADGRRHEARRRAWRLAGAAGAGVGLLLAMRWLVLGTVAGDDPHYAFTLATGWRGTALAAATLPHALWLALVPQIPRLDYSPPDAQILRPAAILVAAGGALLAWAAAAIVAHVRRPNGRTFAACFAICAFLPVSNLALRTGVVLADRTLYGPSVGVALLGGAIVAGAWMRAHAPWRALLVSGAAAVTGVAALITVEGIPSWRDTPSAFAAIRERSPTSYVGHVMCARTLEAAGDPAAARTEYAVAVGLTPHHAPLLAMAAANALRLRDTAAARALLVRAVALAPDAPRSRTALVSLALGQGDTAQASRLLRDGMRRDPTQREWRSTLARLTTP